MTKDLTNILVLQSKVKIGFFDLPVKSFVLKTNSGAVLISPLPNLDPHIEIIKKFASLTDIVAPNLLHHLGAKKAKKHFPDATLWATPGLDLKRADIKWDKSLGKNEWSYDKEIQIVPILGMPRVNEFVFYHKTSRTLIVTDLVFNLQKSTGIGNWLIYHLFDIYKKAAISRLFLTQVQNKNEFEDSLKKIVALDFINIYLPHGENILNNGKEIFVKICQARGYLNC